MHKKINNKIKVLTIAGVISVMGISTIAAPIFKEVKASLKSTIEYRLNDAKVMEGTEALVYNNTLYLPVRAVSETLGLDISYKNNVVSMKTSSSRTTPLADTIIIEEATIKEVNLEGKRVTILPKDAEDTPNQYVVLNIGEDISIAHSKNKRVYRLEDLTTGMSVKVEHSAIMTRSLPPQTSAISLTILNEKLDNEDINPIENVKLENKSIVDVNVKENYIVLGDIKNPENIDAHTIVRISEETIIKHIKNKRAYTINDLEKGQTVNLVISPAMTLSFPPQTTAIEVVLAN